MTVQKATKVVDYVKNNFKDYYLIEGTPSPDLIATISTRYLVDTLKLQKVAHLESPSIIPIVRVANGLAEHPIRIYASKEHKILVLLCDQVIDNNQMFNFSETLIEWCEKKKVKGIISLLGMVPNPNAQQGIVAASNTKKVHELLKANNIPILDNGLISGVSAQLLLLSKNIDAFILLANPGNTTNFDSAAKLLELLGKMFNFKINTQPLEQESKKIIAAIKEKMQQMYAQQNPLQQTNTKPEKGQMMFT
jgi:uncharacterized protein (TIGR00161 family)